MRTVDVIASPPSAARHRHPIAWRVGAVSLALAAWPAQQALAQDKPAAPAAGPAQLEVVNVTAQRKKENSKDVPVSATVLSPDKLEAISTSGQDIRVLAAKVPSLNIESSNGRTFPRLYLRGYGNNDFNTYASQPVSLVYDEVVLENAILKGFPIFDLENVEVLRGPQGTLFGRNTPAGVVKFNSVKPTLGANDGYAAFSLGSRVTLNAEGAVSVPLGKEWAMRVSAQEQHRNDWVTVRSTDATNLYNGSKTEGYDDRAARVQFLYQPSGKFNALFNLHGRDLDGSARVFRANIIQPGTNDLVSGFDPSTITSNGKNEQHYRSYGGNANLTWNLDGMSLHSITAYETIARYFTRGDIDGGDSTNTPFPVETAGGVKAHKQITQEFRLASETSGPLSWQTGLFYFYEDLAGENFGYRSSTGAQTSYSQTEQKNTAWAVFGSVGYDISDQFKLRGGIRYTDDKKTFSKVVGFTDPGDTSLSGAKTTGDLSGTYKINPDVSVYARVATGFRGASFGSPTSGQLLTSALPETTTSYEAGVKADLMNRRARLGFNVYRFDVKNQQLTAVGGNANTVSLTNAAKTVGQGAELDFEALVTDRFKVSIGGSYNDTEIKDPNLKVAVCGSPCTPTNPTTKIGTTTYAFVNGNALPQAPKWIATATARYSVPMANGDELYFYTDWSYRSKINLFLYQSVSFTGKSLLEGGLKVGYNWGNGKYEASVFCRNCANQIRVNGAIDFNNLEGFINDPRTIGAQFRVNFL